MASANIVGYNNTTAGTDLNWYAPTFFTPGANTTDIQDINLNDNGTGAVGMGDSMQIVGPKGNPIAGYFYWMQAMDMTGTVKTPYFWADETFTPVNISFDSGEALAIDNPNSLAFSISNAGEVPSEDASFDAVTDLNWTGNPFPAPISIQSITLDDGGTGAVGMGDSMQIVGPKGNPIAGYFYWVKEMDMTGTVTTPYFWADETFTPVAGTLEPGAGIAIDNPNGLVFKIKIACPY